MAFIADFDKNKIADAIIAFRDKLGVYDFNGTQIYNLDLPENTNSSAVNFYDINNSFFVNIFDDINSNTLILNTEQKTIKEYKSSQPPFICDLFNDGKAYVLIVLNGEFKCVKL